MDPERFAHLRTELGLDGEGRARRLPPGLAPPAASQGRRNPEQAKTEQAEARRLRNLRGAEQLAADFAAGEVRGVDVDVIEPGLQLADLGRREGENCVGMVPLVAFGTPVKGNSTGAFTPIGAGPWMWARVAGEVRPLKLVFTVIVSATLSSTTLEEPVPRLVVGGTS